MKKFSCALNISVLVLVLALTGCNSSYDDSARGTGNIQVGGSKFETMQKSVFEPYCIRCHSGTPPQGDLDLSSFAKLMGTDNVVPGNPEASPLYQLVNNGKMPKNQAMLAQNQIDLIYAWIKAGATEHDNEIKPPVNKATFTWISKNILEPKCIVCHNTLHARGKVDLTSYDTLMASLGGDNGKPVVAGNPKLSTLYGELSGQTMPPVYKPFPQADLDNLKAWIEKGAPEVTAGIVIPKPGQPNPPQPAYEWLTKNTFRYCASCHGLPYKKGNIDFTSYATLLASQGQDRKALIPGDPDNSGILHEMLSGDMPPPRQAILQDQIDAVDQWIQDGAKNN